MTILDLTGMAIVEIRDFPAVTAIVGQKTRPEFAEGEGPPAVIIHQLGIDYHPLPAFRAKLQRPMFAALCYGVTRVQAAQVANAVVEAIESRDTRKDASNRLVFASLVESGGEIELDPVTKWPFATVTFTYLGAQQAIA
jgi:hypothetical protein